MTGTFNSLTSSNKKKTRLSISYMAGKIVDKMSYEVNG